MQSTLLRVLPVIWLAGMLILLGCGLVSWLRLRRQLRTAVHLRDRLWQSENVQSPFVLGLLRPRIYLPFTLAEPQLGYIVAHEQAHLRRGDHWSKLIGYLLLAVYWFHPLVWLAYWLLCRDLELACDERVVRSMALAERKDYSATLLACSIPQRAVVACPLAFGGGAVRQRIQAVLRYRKPAFWLALIGTLCVLAAAVCFLTDPRVRLDGIQSVHVSGQTMTTQPAQDLVWLIRRSDSTPLSLTPRDVLEDAVVLQAADKRYVLQPMAEAYLLSRYDADGTLREQWQMGENFTAAYPRWLACAAQYTAALSELAVSDSAFLVWYPPTEHNEDGSSTGSIRPGELDAPSLLQYLQSRQWSSRRSKLRLPSPGSITFNPVEDVRVTIYKDRRYATLSCGDLFEDDVQEWYYTTNPGDYDAALALIHCFLQQGDASVCAAWYPDGVDYAVDALPVLFLDAGAPVFRVRWDCETLTVYHSDGIGTGSPIRLTPDANGHFPLPSDAAPGVYELPHDGGRYVFRLVSP